MKRERIFVERSVPGEQTWLDRTDKPAQTIRATKVVRMRRDRYGDVAVEDPVELPSLADALDSGNALGLEMPEKSPFRLPTMAEVRAAPRNGYSVVSTFSGCGGSCLGFEMAGFEVLWANEFVRAARYTYRANHPGVHLDERDVREIQPRQILEAIGREPRRSSALPGSGRSSRSGAA